MHIVVQEIQLIPVHGDTGRGVHGGGARVKAFSRAGHGMLYFPTLCYRWLVHFGAEHTTQERNSHESDERYESLDKHCDFFSCFFTRKGTVGIPHKVYTKKQKGKEEHAQERLLGRLDGQMTRSGRSNPRGY